MSHPLTRRQVATVATQQPHEFCGVSWLVVRDGRIIEGGDCWNLNGLIAQMAAPI